MKTAGQRKDRGSSCAASPARRAPAPGKPVPAGPPSFPAQDFPFRAPIRLYEDRLLRRSSIPKVVYTKDRSILGFLALYSAVHTPPPPPPPPHPPPPPPP